jgi:hypothetical protein
MSDRIIPLLVSSHLPGWTDEIRERRQLLLPGPPNYELGMLIATAAQRCVIPV